MSRHKTEIEKGEEEEGIWDQKRMWLPKEGGRGGGFGLGSHISSTGGGGGKLGVRMGGGSRVVAVAIDKDKGSQHALRWAIENILPRAQPLVLIHVQLIPNQKDGGGSDHSSAALDHKQQLDQQAHELFLTFHVYCTRKDIQCIDILLQDTDVAKALAEYVSHSAIEFLVLGAPSRHGFIRRFKNSDVPSHVIKGAPDYCTVYVISKGKISSARNASRPAPFLSPLHDQFQDLQSNSNNSNNQGRRASPHHHRSASTHSFSIKAPERTPRKLNRFHHDNIDANRNRPTGGVNMRLVLGDDHHENMSESSELSDISFVSSGRPSSDISFVSSGRPSTDRTSSVFSDNYPQLLDHSQVSTASSSDRSSFGSSLQFGSKEFSSSSLESGRTSTSSQNMDDVEAEMRRLKLELQKTMDLYSTACKDALTSKQKAVELHRWRLEEERRLEEARHDEQAARAIADKERAKHMETAEASRQRIAELEAQRRTSAEINALVNNNTQEEKEEKKKRMDYCFRYRRYSIDEIEEATEFFAESRKIGEGGYGPVFKCSLDHTPVAVKVLRPDAAQGRSQFQQEVEVLSCMRHPNMVLLLGACPEYGCLVYEYMANGSLEDRLLRRGNTPPLSWQLRFKIAAEIATGILFLHQTKPEPIVHRDLKPGNILLDRNYVSKISDVGLARLVPPSVADEVTQYRMTSTAGTFCYIDPEYQQTGMLGVKSDVYSLGVMLLQIITAKPAMGLTHTVGRSIENGKFEEMLDGSVRDWPVEEALGFAKLALECAELRRKDRPDLGKVVLPYLNRLRRLAEEQEGEEEGN